MLDTALTLCYSLNMRVMGAVVSAACLAPVSWEAVATKRSAKEMRTEALEAEGPGVASGGLSGADHE